jgi:hypothetical protein
MYLLLLPLLATHFRVSTIHNFNYDAVHYSEATSSLSFATSSATIVGQDCLLFNRYRGVYVKTQMSQGVVTGRSMLCLIHSLKCTLSH